MNCRHVFLNIFLNLFRFPIFRLTFHILLIDEFLIKSKNALASTLEVNCFTVYWRRNFLCVFVNKSEVTTCCYFLGFHLAFSSTFHNLNSFMSDYNHDNYQRMRINYSFYVNRQRLHLSFFSFKINRTLVRLNAKKCSLYRLRKLKNWFQFY